MTAIVDIDKLATQFGELTTVTLEFQKKMTAMAVAAQESEKTARELAILIGEMVQMLTNAAVNVMQSRTADIPLRKGPPPSAPAKSSPEVA